MRTHLILAVAAISLLSACGSSTTVRRHEDYANALNRAKTIQLLPADVKVHTSDVSNEASRQYDYEYHVEDLIQHALPPAFNRKGYRVSFLPKKQIKEQKLYQPMEEIRESFNNMYSGTYATRPAQRMNKEKAYKTDIILSERAQVAAARVGGDLMVLVRYNEVVKTDGALTRDFLIGALTGASMGPAEHAGMTVGIIDIKTGRLLWANHANDVSSMLGSAFAGDDMAQKRVELLITEVLKGLPDKQDLFKPEE